MIIRDHRFSKANENLISRIDCVIEKYQDQNIKMTLRQLYYQLVAGDIISNNQREYAKLSKLLTDARYAGKISWDAIEDRIRIPRRHPQFRDIADLINAAKYSYRLDRWENQDHYVEIWCLANEATVFTKNGIKNIKDIKVGDYVLTHRHRFKKVTKLFSRKYKGIVNKIKPYYLQSFRCNDKHPFLAMQSKKCKYHDKTCKETCYRANICSIAHYKYYEIGWHYASDLRKNDFLVVPRYKKIIDKKEISIVDKRIFIDDAFMRMVGLYLAEGSIRSDNRSIKFTFNIKETSYIEFIKSYFKKRFKYTVSIYESKKNNTADVVIYNKKLSEFFKQFGIGASNKKMPNWFLWLPFEKQADLLDALIDGDGYRSEYRDAIATVSKEMAHQIKFLFDRLGIISSLSISQKAKNHPLANYDLYRIAISGKKRFTLGIVKDNYILIPIQKISRVKFNNYLYNFSVQDDNSYSIGVLTHNTEKDAISSVIKPVTDKYHVYMSVNRGYSSATAMYDAAYRFIDQNSEGKYCTLLYLGDHDPSGLDMVRDIQERLNEFGAEVTVQHIALLMEQIEELDPPPNPAKMSDPRSGWYRKNFGDVSWEVDAIPPDLLIKIIEASIADFVDLDKMDKIIKKEESDLKKLDKYAKGI